MAISDEAGTIYYRFVYDTYGELSDITTDDGVSLKSSEQLTEYRLSELAHATGIDYLYNGQYGVETDQNGLYYMRARYYDQDIKRFINWDVVSGDISNSQSLNRYCYVQGNPVSLTDPFGLCPDGNSVSEDSAIGWLLKCLDSSGSLYSTYANRVSPKLHTGLDLFGFFNDGADAINGILYFLEGNTKLGIEYTLRGLTFYGALIGGPVGAGLILLGIGFNLGFAAQGMAGAIDRAYTDYQNGTLGWHNLADLGLNGLAVAGGLHVGAKRLQRAANMSVPRTLETSPATVGTGRGPRLNTYGDALREKLGPAYLSHPEEYNAILGKAKEMGVSIEFRPGTLAYDMEFGKAGKLIIDPDASIGALRHEYRHMLDDFSLGHPGMRIIADSDMFWKLEFRGYLEELNLARQLKDYDAGKFIIKEMRQRRMEILGR